MLEVIGWYFSIFIMAATPWLEMLVVIPIGIGAGLNPVAVGFIAFLGNAIPVFLLLYKFHWLTNNRWYLAWKKKRELNKQRKNEQINEEKLQKKQARKERMQRIFEKYGLAGLAITGPAITGIHLATLFAMAFKANKTKIALWMNASLALWAAGMTVASFYGIEWMLSWFG
ncbi:small multi-drug export protein [Bacillus sp. FJAT-44742]|uniref:small multi-drug export protein n=1 Tax=Bacillus sp. FJAT-44742 TaxID=2014005 RepID=UPI000C24949E|nr:small multi-drug export protein [Bacillus sp. FJAT-44742]